MQSVTININSRCPLSCAHCMVGFSPSQQGSGWRIDPAVLTAMIHSLDPSTCPKVLLAGGEPTLDRDLIRTAVLACQDAGIKIGIISAPVWASTPASAKRLFESVGRLDVLMLSYDRYHLEFLALRNYENAIVEAVSRGTAVTLHISYATDEELRALNQSVAFLRPLLRDVSAMRVFPYGNAARAGGPAVGSVTIESVDDLRRVPRSCILGAAVVDDTSRVHGCCWSVIAAESPFARDVKSTPLGAALRDIEGGELFRRMHATGFLDSLTADGQAEVAARLKGQAVTQECEVCVKMMTRAAAPVWRECRDTP